VHPFILRRAQDERILSLSAPGSARMAVTAYRSRERLVSQMNSHLSTMDSSHEQILKVYSPLMGPQPVLWYFADPMCSWCLGVSRGIREDTTKYDWTNVAKRSRESLLSSRRRTPGHGWPGWGSTWTRKSRQGRQARKNS
jgi:hypothetical protein